MPDPKYIQTYTVKLNCKFPKTIQYIRRILLVNSYFLKARKAVLKSTDR